MSYVDDFFHLIGGGFEFSISKGGFEFSPIAEAFDLDGFWVLLSPKYEEKSRKMPSQFQRHLHNSIKPQKFTRN